MDGNVDMSGAAFIRLNIIIPVKMPPNGFDISSPFGARRRSENWRNQLNAPLSIDVSAISDFRILQQNKDGSAYMGNVGSTRWNRRESGSTYRNHPSTAMPVVPLAF